MRSFLSKLYGWLRGPSPTLVCDPTVWSNGVDELARRTRNCTRESGAFLLGPVIKGRGRIVEFVFYDDIDPRSLDTGIVRFAGNKLPLLWAHCRQQGYGVLADVHVHPGGYGQSLSDRADPVMPRAGHIAFIVPDFAQRPAEPGHIGMYEYLGNGDWADHTREGRSFFRLEAAR